MKTLYSFVLSAGAVLGCAAGLSTSGAGGGYSAPMAPETATTADQQKWDPKAVALVDQMVAALGGEGAWNGVGEVQALAGFNDGPKRILSVKHLWDRATGRHRYDCERPGEPAFFVAHRVDNAAAGKAYVRRLGTQDSKTKWAGADEHEHLRQRALAGFRRELFWLTAPYRLKASGAELRMQADQPGPDDRTYDILDASFSGADWRPSERLRIFVDKTTHLPAHVLMFDPGKDKARWGYTLEGWKQVGPVKVATMWKSLNGRETLTFANLAFEPRAVDNDLYMPWLNPTIPVTVNFP